MISLGSENIKEASATTETDKVMSNVVQIERNQETNVKTRPGGEALLCQLVTARLFALLAPFVRYSASLVFFELSPQVCRGPGGTWVHHVPAQLCLTHEAKKYTNSKCACGNQELVTYNREAQIGSF